MAQPGTGLLGRLRSRRLLLALGAVVLLVVGIAVAVAVRLERNAMLFAETGQSAIRLLGELRDAIQARDPDDLEALYLASVSASDPSTWERISTGSRDGIETFRWRGTAAEDLAAAAVAAGWVRWMGPDREIDLFKIKLDRVLSHRPGEAEVRAFLWLREPAAERTESRLWLRLLLTGEAGSWRIAGQQLEGGETVVGRGTAFTDVALAAGVEFEPRANPAWATDEWFPHRYGIIRYSSAGVSANDFDGDGWDDLFFADGAAPRLYRNLGDGTFADVTAAAGLGGDLHGVNVALFLDLDNDGDRDLFLGVFTGANRLFRNEGDGTFTDVTEGAGLGGELVTVASSADVDGDGLLDLYLGRYLDPRVALPTTFFHARNGGANSLLRNLGGLRFAEVAAGQDGADRGLALGTAFADFDGDGDQDLYVANDVGRNALLRNDDGVLRDVAAEREALDFGFGMSATWADLDNDRDLDLYVSNLHSGQRWYGQAVTSWDYVLNSLRQGTLFSDLPLFADLIRHTGLEWTTLGDRMTRGNSLLRNDGGRFVNVTEEAGTNPFGWYWGAAALDFDHDGWLDLYAANGWISAADLDDL